MQPEQFPALQSKELERIEEKANSQGLGANLEMVAACLHSEVRRLLVLQQPYSNQLERLAESAIQKIFGLEREELVLDLSLKGSLREVSADSPDFDLARPAGQLSEAGREELRKRHYVNSVIHGAGVCIQDYFFMLKDELDALDPGLLPLSDRVMTMAMLLMQNVPAEAFEQATHGDNLGGITWLDNSEYRIVHVRGAIFPLLLHEATKGVVEALAAQGLPLGEEAQLVIDHADRLIFEGIHMKQGPEIWRTINKAMGANLDQARERSFMLQEFFCLGAEDFETELKTMLRGEESLWLRDLRTRYLETRSSWKEAE